MPWSWTFTFSMSELVTAADHREDPTANAGTTMLVDAG